MKIDSAQRDRLSVEVSSATERWLLFATILASSMAFIDSSALNLALASLQVDLQASGAQLLWIVNGYLLMLAALILIVGALALFVFAWALEAHTAATKQAELPAGNGSPPVVNGPRFSRAET